MEAVFSQQVPSTNFSTIDGLPNNSVYSIYKDSRGILWVGTANGLSAIQNGEVKNYFTSDGLAHNSCWAIVEDVNHNMWFGSHGGGLTFYDGKKFTVINSKKGLINDKIRKLFIHKNLLYVGTEFGISVLDIKTHKIILNKKITGSTNLFQVMGFFDFQSKVYFQTFNDGLWSIDLKSKNIHLATKQKGAVFSLFKTNDSLYLANTDSLNNSINKTHIVDYIGNKKSKTSFGSTVFWDFVKDKRGIIYSAGNGINFSTGGIFKNEKDKLTNVNTIFGVDSNEVWSLYYDEKLDILYVGTIDKGLYKIDLTEQINHYPSSFFNKPKLVVVDIVNTEKENLILHKNGLLFLTEHKITKELRNKSFYDFAQYRFRTNPKLEEYEYFVSFLKTKLNGFELRGIKIINSIIWINSTIGLFSVNKEGVIVDYYPLSTSAFDFIKPNKIIFQVAYGQFCEVNNFRNNTIFKEYEPNNLNIPKDAFTILTIENKRYIASYSNGLYTYENGKLYSFYFNNIWKEKELVHAKINDKKELIIANSFGDVFIIDVLKGFKIIKKIDRKQLIGNSISFLESYKDYLFIGTEKGLNIYKNGVVRLIDEEQGLTCKAFTSSNIKGTILTMGTKNGFFEFNFKSYISQKTPILEIKIKGIDVNFEAINEKHFKWLAYNSKSISLPYNKNTISFAFEPHNVEYPDKLEYRYKVIGLTNSNWSKWTKDKNVNLTYLPNGNYTMRLETKDLFSGVVSTNDILEIQITPPFWKTYWFISTSFILICLCVYLIYRNRIGKITREERAKSEVQKRLAETKMEALQSKMNPHFIFNAMNSIQNYIIDNNTDDALMYMGEFSKIIRKTLNNSSVQRIALSEEIEYLKSYIKLENMRFKNQVEFELIIDEELDLFETEIPPMLIQPFIENVFVHAFDSHSINPKLIISFKQSDNYLFCKIIDNGKGMQSRNLNKLHASKGTDLAKERIALFQENNDNPITIRLNPNEGTTVVLKLQMV
ncbi:sensor histidine kinase [Flavobacterium muglaense]|uniref:Histidine kinase n=1 Tax=Flavobacterium muglaense TaxID=2764716 RepID=A0A923N4D1_9FLAO|nr:histidine kinase [Flavobacterium muglaense]MBC5839292.1 histidine kinase [Flavobacterium muglaense]MBC5845810.1 histidine kinase [Flavobacterium muglaense]